MYFDNEKKYCSLCSDVVDSTEYYENEGFCKSCFEQYIEECEDCGELFHEEYMICGRCENCYDLYRDEMHEEDEY